VSSAALHAALAYRARGFSVLPAAGKRPHFDLLEATSGSKSFARLRRHPAGEAEIAAWYERDPNAGVAIITGTPSGIAVADIEGEEVSRPEARALRLFQTPTATTPSGGRHLYFQLQSPLPTRRTRWGELRADGSYVVAPSGKPDRAWEIGFAEARLIALASTPLLNDKDTSASEEISPLGEISSRGIRSAETKPRIQPSLDDLASWDAYTPYVDAIRALLGIDAPIGGKFPCLLPGAPDQDPSANLWRDPHTERIVYRCWQRAVTHPVHRVYAAITAGRSIEELRWSRAIAALWKIRTLLDTGMIAAPPIALPKTAAGADVEALQRLFQARALMKLGISTTLVPDVLGPWLGMSADAAKELRYQWRKLGLIKKTGEKIGGADLYLPGDAP
jgi:Bifunctional DNA primase/polymerase, N-terminal